MFARRRRPPPLRQYAPASYTASHVDHENKKRLGFKISSYVWFSSVSPISIGMELRFPAFVAGEAPL